MLHLKIKNIIKSTNISLTKSRKKVLIVFLKASKPISLKYIRSAIGKMDRVTLFRILSLFEEKGIIHSIRFNDVNTLYALCNDECSGEKHNHNHIHFQCIECDDVSCLNIKEFPTIKIPNYTISNLNINASGICLNCS
ncbi:MAG: Fur family transcriptional regulator [Flavobacteriales bacterium]|nr:Fur family transcriptional regulator [Flavobacteriales bacterium]